jgi:hypothetical protein
LEEELLVRDRLICEDTGGHFVLSCLDTTELECDYVPESFCECAYDTEWVDQQGCILKKGEDLIEFTEEDLVNGWYLGLNTQKKLNTPSEWLWEDRGGDSAWHRPN